MKKIYMTLGLPGCGKTTLAKQMQEKDPGLVRVNKDDLRAMMHDSKWSSKREKQILVTRDAIIRDSLTRGHSVIVDDTGFGRHEKDLRVLAGVHGAEFELIDMTDVPLETCVERDLKRPNSVGSKVIMRMYNQFMSKKEDERKLDPMIFDESLPYCIISDLDGTISHIVDRSPYDGKSCGSDLVNTSVADLLSMYRTHDVSPIDKIIILSGRNGDSEPETRKWLADNQIVFDELHMRKPGDDRKDSIVKEEMFNEFIRDKYNVLFVVDDRPSVCRLWRSLGLTVLQVGDPDVDF